MGTIYKLGSKGDAVKDIQLALRAAGYVVTADGYYGPRTQAAVKMFQQSRGIGNDGIVGPVTMAKLNEVLAKAQESDKPAGINIVNAFINVHITRCTNRVLKYIAIHYTAGSTSGEGAAMRNRNVFLQRQASADFVVDDNAIIQVNPDPTNYYCWAIGDNKNPWTGGARLNGKAVNKNTVSIEMCSNLKKGASAMAANHDGWYLTEQTLENARKLVRYLMKRYCIPKENVIRHYDATGKLCPGVPGWNDGPLYTAEGKRTNAKSDSKKWTSFLASI